MKMTLMTAASWDVTLCPLIDRWLEYTTSPSTRHEANIWSTPLTYVLGVKRDTRWRSCLWHYAKSRKFAGSIPDGVIGVFHWQNPSGCIIALGMTQPLTGMSTRNISWGGGGGKGGRCVELTTLPPSCADCLEIWESQRSELSQPVQACNGFAFPYCKERKKYFWCVWS